MEDRQNRSLYDPRFEHDACGIGAVVDLKGKPSHQTVSDALSIVEKLRHRAGRDAAGETASTWAARGITAWACFSCPRTGSAAAAA